MTDYQLVAYCFKNNCIECEMTTECKEFFFRKGRLPYRFYKPERYSEHSTVEDDKVIDDKVIDDNFFDYKNFRKAVKK